MHCCLLSPTFCKAHFQILPGSKALVLDKDSDETYNYDSKGLVRGKCIALVFGNLLRTVAFTIAALAKAFFLLLTPFYKPLFFMIRGVTHCHGWKRIRNDIKADFKQWPQNMKAACFSAAFTVFYGTLIEGGALIGVVHPFFGRKIVSKSELEWSEVDCLFRESVIMAPCFQTRPYGLQEDGILEKFS